MQISADLPPALVPLAWLIGRWEGAGVAGYPTIESANFGQELVVSSTGEDFLRWESRSWLLDAAGAQVRPLASEVGYWRIHDGGRLEVLLSHMTGYVEIYLGRVDGPRVELSTDVVARTETAKDYSGATRLYGLVQGDLMWVMDMTAMGQPAASHVSAQLKRVG